MFVLFLSGLAATAHALVGPPSSWPTTFTAFKCLGAQANDLIADASGAQNDRDIVGDATYSAGGWASDQTYMFIRFRLNGNVIVTGGGAPLSPFGWGAGIDTDGVLSNGYEYTLVTNGIDETVNLHRISDKTKLASWTPTVATPGFNQVVFPTGDGSKFSNNDDSFLDMAAPLADLIDLTKADPKPIKLGKVTFWVGTSSNGVFLDKDSMCWDDTSAVDLSKSAADGVAIGPYVQIDSPTVGATVNTVTPTLTGLSSPNASVVLTSGTKTATVTADVTGKWTLLVPSDWGFVFGSSVSVSATVKSNVAGVADGKAATTFQIACATGFEANGTTCKEIDNCATNNGGCSANATCTKTGPGTNSCTCKAGYTGDGKTCTDIDECKAPVSPCAADATCANSPGSFSCACKPGYTGDGKACTDVNECLTNNGGCSADATCTNTPGANTCACKTGYSGDGITCANKNECTLLSHNCAATATWPML